MKKSRIEKIILTCDCGMKHPEIAYSNHMSMKSIERSKLDKLCCMCGSHMKIEIIHLKESKHES